MYCLRVSDDVSDCVKIVNVSDEFDANGGSTDNGVAKLAARKDNDLDEVTNIEGIDIR